MLAKSASPTDVVNERFLLYRVLLIGRVLSMIVHSFAFIANARFTARLIFMMNMLLKFA